MEWSTCKANNKGERIMADVLAGEARILKDHALQIAMLELADSSVNRDSERIPHRLRRG